MKPYADTRAKMDRAKERDLVSQLIALPVSEDIVERLRKVVEPGSLLPQLQVFADRGVRFQTIYRLEQILARNREPLNAPIQGANKHD